MTSLLIRKVDEAAKKRLRLQAARNGRSMEEEARQILLAGVQGTGTSPQGGTRTSSTKTRSESSNLLPAEDTVQADGGSRILLIISGGIAAYKSLDLIRRLRERGMAVRVVMTETAQAFVTPLAAGALAGGKVFTELFDQAQEFDVGHIRLARECDAVVVAPATADLMAKAALGLASDLASAVLLATNRPVLMVP